MGILRQRVVVDPRNKNGENKFRVERVLHHQPWISRDLTTKGSGSYPGREVYPGTHRML